MADTQINVGMNVDGVITGTDKAKRKIGELGGAAREAGRGTGAIGDGMAATSQKVESATRNMIASIQRQTAALESGSKASREYQESLARSRGVDTAALRPYLDQLDAVREKQERAAQASELMESAGVAAGLAFAAAAAGLAASVKSVIDTADSFSKMSAKTGVAVEALRELNYAASMSDVSTEALGVNMQKLTLNMSKAAGGAKEQSEVFKAMGVSVKDASGQLKGSGDVLQELAGKFANYADGPEKAALAMQIFGESGAAMIPLLNSGAQGLKDMAQEANELGTVFGGDMAKQAEAFNDSLTRIQTLTQSGAITIANELLPTLNLLTNTFLESAKQGKGFGSDLATGVRVAMEAIVILYSDVEFVLKAMGREIGAVAAQLAALGRLDFKGFTAISDAVKEDGKRAREELDKFQKDVLNARFTTSQAGAGRGTAADPRVLGDIPSMQTVAPVVQKAAEGAKKALKEMGDEFASQRAAAADWAKTMGDFAKIQRDTEAASDGLSKAQARLVEYLGSTAYTDASDEMRELALQSAYAAIASEQLAAAKKEEAKALDDSIKAYADLVEAQQGVAQTAAQNLQAQLDQNAAIGLTAAELAALEVAKLNDIAASKEQRASALDIIDTSGQLGNAYRAEAKALRDLASAKAAGAAKQAVADRAKDAADEWKRTSDKIEQDLTDALMRGFESGKGFAETLRDTVENMFKTLVLRPIVSAVVSPVAGAITGSLGLAGAANAGQGGNLLGTASNLSSAYDTLSNGISNAVSAGFEKLISNGVGEKLGLYTGSPMTYTTGSGVSGGLTSTGATLGQYAGMAGNALAGYGLQKAISGGYKTGESGIVDAITVAASAYFGPIAGVAAGAFNRAFGRKLKDQGIQGQFGGEAGFTGENYQFLKGGWFRSDKTKTSPLDADMQSGLAHQFKALQVQTALMATVLGDTGQSVADFTSSIKLSFNGLTEAQIGEKLAETFTGIANDLAKTVLGDSAFAKEGEAASQTLQRLSTSLTTVNGTFDALGFSLQAVSLAGADAASDFIDLIGGLDAFKAATAGYYANFYTEAERQGKATEQLAAQLAGLGQALPTTRDGFRALVESAEAAGNTTLLAGLLNLQDEFAALVPAAQDAANAVAKSVDTLQGKKQALQVRGLEAVGDKTGAAALQRSIDTQGMTAAEVALYDYNQALEAHVDELTRAAQSIKTLGDETSSLRVQLLQAQGDTAGAKALQRATDTQGFTAAEVAAYDYNQSLRDQIAAAQAASESAQNLAGALGNVSTAADESRRAANQAIAQAMRSSAEYTFSRSQRDIDAAMRGSQAMYQARIKSVQDQIDSISGIASAIAAAKDRLNPLASQPLTQTTYKQALYEVDRAATEGGIRQPGLDAALTAVSGDTTGLFGRREDWSMQQARALGSVTTLNTRAQTELAALQSMVVLLEEQARVEQERMEALKQVEADRFESQMANLENQLANDSLQLAATYDSASTIAGAVDASAGTIASALGSAFGGMSSAIASIGSAGSWSGPSYAVGTPFVPQDGLAMLHKGEMVVPAAYNPNNVGYVNQGASNAEVVAELRAVREELAAIKSATTATAGFTAGTDRQLRRVIKSDAISTETIA